MGNLVAGHVFLLDPLRSSMGHSGFGNVGKHFGVLGNQLERVTERLRTGKIVVFQNSMHRVGSGVNQRVELGIMNSHRMSSVLIEVWDVMLKFERCSKPS